MKPAVDAIRESGAEDQVAIEAIYPLAFPDEDLLPLLRSLWRQPEDVLSLVAIDSGDVIGHAMFTRCGLRGRSSTVALLGPVAVSPAKQRGGVGSALIREGCRRLAEEGVGSCCVLGDPAYYGRFGFSAESDILPPYRLPQEWQTAWQSIPLGESREPAAGTLEVPAAWRDPALWLP
jgi:putative acetyltransferase